MRKSIVLILMVAIMMASAAGAQQQEAVGRQPTISGDLTLAGAVQTALKHNPMVQSAGYVAAAARARVSMAKAMTSPQISVSAFGGTSSMGDIMASPPNIMPSSLFTVPNKTGAVGQAALMIPLYTGGRLSGAVNGAAALAAAAASDRVSTEHDVALEAKTAYHQVLLAQSTIGVFLDLVDEETERVRVAEAAFKEGRIAKYDLLRNQAGLADAQQQLTNADRDAQVAMLDLKMVLGVSPVSSIVLSDRLAYMHVTGTADDYLGSALKNRSEIAGARAKLDSANASVEVAKSAYMPQVYATAMEGLSATSDGTNTGLTAGIIAGLPILDGGERRAAVKEAEAMRDAMKQDEQQAVLLVQHDVNVAWAELQSADKNVQLSQAAVAQAEEDYRVVKLRYEAGKAVNVEVLDALAALVKAQNNSLRALYEHNIARDRLARAIGSDGG